MSIKDWFKSKPKHKIVVSKTSHKPQPTQNNQDFMVNDRGHFVPKITISQLDIERDKMVQEISHLHEELNQTTTDIKTQVKTKLDDYRRLSSKLAEVEYKQPLCTETYYSFDKKYKLVSDVHRRAVPNDNARHAITLIQDCARRWLNTDKAELVALADQLLDLDSLESYDRGRLDRLSQIQSDDPQWTRAIKLMHKGFDRHFRKRRERIYKKDENGDYKMIQTSYHNIIARPEKIGLNNEA